MTGMQIVMENINNNKQLHYWNIMIYGVNLHNNVHYNVEKY